MANNSVNFNLAMSKIYHFISQKDDLKSEFDLDGSGEIIEAECRYYIAQNFDKIFGDDGFYSDNKGDIISNFWKSINTNGAGKSIVSLDERELAAITKRIELEKVVSDFIQNLEAPNDLTGSHAGEWKPYVQEVLMTELDKKGGVGAKGLETEAQILDFLKSVKEKVSAQASAMCLFANKADKIKDEEGNDLKDLAKYFPNGTHIPSDLQKLIDNAIENVKAGTSIDEITTLVDNTYNDYINAKNLTDLNKAKLKEDWNTKLKNAVAGDDEVQKALQALEIKNEEIEKIIDDFVGKKVDDLPSTDNFDSYKNNVNGAKLLSEFQSKLEEIKQRYKHKIAEEKVNGLLKYETETEEKTVTVDVAQQLKDHFGTNITTQFLYAQNSPFRSQLNQQLGELIGEDAFSEYPLSDVLNEAFASESVSDIEEPVAKLSAIIDYVVAKYGITSITKTETTTKSADNKVYDELVKLGVDSDLAKAILELEPNKRQAEYKEKLDEIIEKLANETIKEEDLPSEIAQAIKDLIDTTNTFVSLQSTIDAAKAAKLNTLLTDRTEDIISDSAVNTVRKQNAILSFRILNDGTIEFVKWDNNSSGGIWSKEKDSTVQGYFDTIKNKCENSYSEVFKALNLTEKEKSALWNTALLMTLSDSGIVDSMYKGLDLNNVVNSVVKKYHTLLDKIARDNNAKKFLTSDGSLVAGRTLATDNDAGDERFVDDVNGTMTHHMYDYYKDNTTYDDDDWVAKSKGKDGTYLYNNTNYDILLWKTNTDKDDAAVNASLSAILTDYIQNYKAYIKVDDIIVCFKRAEETAFDKLYSITSKTSAQDNTGSAATLYGYSENGGYGNNGKDYADYDTLNKNGNLAAQSILLAVMFEMERELAKKMFE